MNKVSVSEMSESITGFDEIAIERVMGVDLYAQDNQKPMMLMRSLVFVAFKREGLADHEAREKALSLSVKDINNFFEEEADDAIPSEPDSEQGKDGSAAA